MSGGGVSLPKQEAQEEKEKARSHLGEVERVGGDNERCTSISDSPLPLSYQSH